jgi:uncharacterized protein YdaU (DUF1376 family)
MNGLPYYKRYPRDFIEGTIGMPFELKGCYSVILDMIYMQGGKLPDDARYISGLLGCSIRKWKSLRDELVGMGKLKVSGEFLTNYRAVSELETLAKLQDKQRENASTLRKNKDLEKPRQRQPEPEPDITDTNVSVGTPEKKKPARRTQLPADWSPSPKNILDAENAGLSWQDVNREAQQFADYHHSRASLMADWDAAWRTWCRNAVKFAARRGGASHNQESDLQRISRMANEALREGKLQ